MIGSYGQLRLARSYSLYDWSAKRALRPLTLRSTTHVKTWWIITVPLTYIAAAALSSIKK